MADKLLQLSVKVNAQTGELEVLGAKLRGAGEAAKQAGSQFSGLSGEAKSLLSSFLPFATGAGIAAFFSSAVKGAEEENEALRRLKFGLESTGQSWNNNKDSILSWGAAIQQTTRFSDTEAFASLDKLVRVTGNLETAQKASQLAMGLSVASGKDLASSQEIVTNLIIGQERALIQAKREFGAFTGEAKTTQDALDSLSAKLGDAAFKTEGYTDSTKKLKHAFDDFQESVGNGLIPSLITLTQWGTKTIDIFNQITLVVEGYAAKVLVRLEAFGAAANSLLHLDFEGVRGAFEVSASQIAAIEENMVMQAGEMEARKTAAVVQGAETRVMVNATAAAEEQRKAAETAAKVVEEKQKSSAKIAQIELALDKQIFAMGKQTYANKIQLLQLEVAAERAKIIMEVQDQEKRAQLLDKLKLKELKQTQEYQKEEFTLKRTAALEIVDLSIQALETINAMSEVKTREDARRAKFLLTLEKGIAIAKAIAAAQDAGPFAAGIAAAQIALISAQFAQQVQAINEARRVANAEREELKVTTDLGSNKELSKIFTDAPNFSGDLKAGALDFSGVGVGGVVDLGGGGGAAFSPSGAGGGSGGGPTTIIIQVGGVTVNVYPDNLSLDDAQVVLRKLGDEVARGTNEGITFALRVDQLIQRFSSLAR